MFLLFLKINCAKESFELKPVLKVLKSSESLKTLIKIDQYLQILEKASTKTRHGRTCKKGSKKRAETYPLDSVYGLFGWIVKLFF